MRDLVKISGLAALMAFGMGLGTPPASAQGLDIRIGRDRPYVERRVIERRVVGPRRRVCRTEIRERIRPNGVVVRRPVQVCTTRGF
jgi:hypothetical protein